MAWYRSPEGLRGILYDGNAHRTPPGRQVLGRPLPVQRNCEHRARHEAPLEAQLVGLLDLLLVQEAILGIHIREGRQAAAPEDRARGRHEGEGRHDDRISWLQAERPKHQNQGVRSGGDGHDFRARPVRELFLQGLHLGPQHEAPALQDARDGFQFLLAEGRQRALQVKERNPQLSVP